MHMPGRKEPDAAIDHVEMCRRPVRDAVNRGGASSVTCEDFDPPQPRSRRTPDSVTNAAKKGSFNQPSMKLSIGRAKTVRSAEGYHSMGSSGFIHSLAVLVLIAGGCGGAEDSVTPRTTIVSVTVTPPTLSLFVGNHAYVKARVVKPNGQKAGTAVRWESSAPEVASVFGYGDSAVVRAVGPGKSTVRATSRDSTGQVIVTVLPTLQVLTVIIDGDGQGSVTSSPQGLSCARGTCIAGFALGTVVHLAASAAPGSMFGTWGGSCNASGPCIVVMNTHQTVRATFEAISGVTAGAATSSPGLRAVTNVGRVRS